MLYNCLTVPSLKTFSTSKTTNPSLLTQNEIRHPLCKITHTVLSVYLQTDLLQVDNDAIRPLPRETITTYQSGDGRRNKTKKKKENNNWRAQNGCHWVNDLFPDFSSKFNNDRTEKKEWKRDPPPWKWSHFQTQTCGAHVVTQVRSFGVCIQQFTTNHYQPWPKKLSGKIQKKTKRKKKRPRQ